MDLDRQRRLQREIIKERLLRLRAWFYVFAFVGAIGVLFIGMSPTDTTIVTGISEARRVSIHEEGHDLFLVVKLDNTEKLVHVKLPQSTKIKIGAKVKLRENKTFLGATTYGFSSYIE